MANLYRKPVVVTDPATGQKVKTQSKKWWGQYKDADGRLRRHPLAVDKLAAQTMLNELVRLVERERKRPLEEHIAEFRAYLENKGVSTTQTGEAVSQIEKMAAGRKWKSIADITASSALEFLGDLRRQGRSAQTYNHYLKSAKQFTRWLVSDRRTPSDPLAHVARLNVATDRRHDRRALTTEELTCLIEAAKAGKKGEKMNGRDRAMLYILSAWTGFRKGELGSLTPSSLCLDVDPPTATVAASYSKRRREDTQVLQAQATR
jgi:site-specific recombinase XerD